jgi:FKBP-type peptidyl-prolyl cis-trans isomerase
MKKLDRNKGLRFFAGLVVMSLFIQACSKDLPEPYNPVLQLEIDLNLIDEYVATNNLTVEIEPNSKMRYIIEEDGNDIKAVAGDTVYVNYELSLLDGTFLDTSIEQKAIDNNIFNQNRNYVPFGFIVGGRMVIPGFEIGTQLLEEEGAGTFIIPSVYGYGNSGSGSIPANTNLIFKISITKIYK